MKRVLFFAVLLAWSGLASAVVYKWVDAQGNVQYGDNPPADVHAQVVQLLVRQTPDQAPAPKAQSAPAIDSADQQQVAEEKATVQQDVAAARQKQCADAQSHYQQLIEGRHMYRTGANGEREYLTSEEIDAARLSAKRDVDSLCANNSP